MSKPDVITIDVEKPAAGGRMLARHRGQIVLVRGAIPGERVRATVERAGKGVLYADTTDVLTSSTDRRDPGSDWQCGGNVYAHITYERQCVLKGEIIRDALARIGRVPLAAAPEVMPSPEFGYRMRARLHVRGGRIGFFREGTHELCDAASTRQLLPDTGEWIAAMQREIARQGLTGISEIEIAENMPGDERACYFETQPGADRTAVEHLVGVTSVSDVLHVRPDDPGSAVRLRRDVRAFFQGNRFLLEPLVRRVVARVPAGPVLDLYAGVGLFGLSLAAVGVEDITLVEGDRVSGISLEENAEPFLQRVRVHRQSVESFLLGDVGRVLSDPETTVIVDPPRTGMSKEALAGIVAARPSRIVYVSCDVATLARDTRTLLNAGYELEGITGIDLFPNTAHVEALTYFVQASTNPSNNDRNSPVR